MNEPVYPTTLDGECDLYNRLHGVFLSNSLSTKIVAVDPHITGIQRDSFEAKYPIFLAKFQAYELSDRKNAQVKEELEGLVDSMEPEARFFVNTIVDYQRRFPGDPVILAIITALNLTVTVSSPSKILPANEAPDATAGLLEGHPETIAVRAKKGDKLDKRGKNKRLIIAQLMPPDRSQVLSEIHIENGHRTNLLNFHDAAGMIVRFILYFLSADGDRSTLHTTIEVTIPGVFDPASIARHLGQHHDDEDSVK